VSLFLSPTARPQHRVLELRMLCERRTRLAPNTGSIAMYSSPIAGRYTKEKRTFSSERTSYAVCTSAKRAVAASTCFYLCVDPLSPELLQTFQEMLTGDGSGIIYDRPSVKWRSLDAARGGHRWVPLSVLVSHPRISLVFHNNLEMHWIYQVSIHGPPCRA
jgi:hypothetical protein